MHYGTASTFIKVTELYMVYLCCWTLSHITHTLSTVALHLHL